MKRLIESFYKKKIVAYKPGALKEVIIAHIASMNVCLFCSELLIGRADKKYCDVQCKNGFHNAQLKKTPSQELRILQRILQNRIQIKLLLGAESRKEVTYEELKSVGVDIDFVTHFRSKKGEKQPCCFEFALSLKEELVCIELVRESVV